MTCLARSFLPRAARPSALLCMGALALAGCAGVPTTHLARGRVALPLKVLAVQAPMAVDAARLQEVVAPGVRAPLAFSDPRLAQAARHAEAQADSAMSAALGKVGNVAVVAPPGQGGEIPIGGLDFDSAITPAEAARLRAATGADAVLRYSITDYGLTPRAWRQAYIAFEVVSTVALAAVIAYSGSKAAKAAAGLYLVQESAEEAASAYAGFQALDAAGRPVRIEARLVGLNPPAVLWRTSATGLSDLKLSRYFRKVGAAERDRQLDAATAAAAAGVAGDLGIALEVKKLEQAIGLP